MTEWMIQNSLMAGALALVVALVSRLNPTRPALCHMLWLLVCVTLIAPPLPVGLGLGAALRQNMMAWLPAQEDTATLGMPAAAEPGLADEPSGLMSLASLAADDVSAMESPTPQPTALPMGAASPTFVERLGDVSASTWLMWVWFSGAAVVLTWQQRRIRSFHHDVRRASLAPRRLTAMVGSVAAKMGVRAPEVRVVAGVGSPSVWCFGPPRLLWPAGTEGCDSTLIAHELAHIARRDHWVSRCEAVAAVVLWWHPLFWVLRRQIHNTSELSCDAWATWAYPADRRAYAEALIEAQERTVAASIALQGLCATGRDTKDFERRLNMIMKHRTSRRVSRLAATAAIVATTLVLPGFSDETASHTANEGQTAQSRVEGLVDAHLLGEKAEQLFSEGEYESALAVFKKQLALDPDNGKAHGRVGYLLIGRGEYEAASGHLAEQVAAGYRADVGTYNLACAAALAGHTAAAVNHLRTALSLGFGDTKLLASDSDLDALRGDAAFDAVVAMADKAAALRESIANLKSMLGDEDKLSMKASLGKIVSADGKMQHELGLELLNVGKLEAAAEAFERQARAGYLQANAHYNIACSQALMGDVESAMSSLTLAAKLGMRYDGITNDADLASLRGNPRFEKLQQLIGAPKLSMKTFASALKAGDGDQAAMLLDELCQAEGSPAAALKLAGWGQCELGKAALSQGQAKQALAHFEQAIDAGYPSDEAVFHMAQVFAKVGEEAAALKHVKSALTLGFSGADDVAKLLESAALGNRETREKLVAWAQKTADYDSYAQDKKKAKLKQKDWEGGQGQPDVRQKKKTSSVY